MFQRFVARKRVVEQSDESDKSVSERERETEKRQRSSSEEDPLFLLLQELSVEAQLPLQISESPQDAVLEKVSLSDALSESSLLLWRGATVESSVDLAPLCDWSVGVMQADSEDDAALWRFPASAIDIAEHAKADPTAAFSRWQSVFYAAFDQLVRGEVARFYVVADAAQIESEHQPADAVSSLCAVFFHARTHSRSHHSLRCLLSGASAALIQRLLSLGATAKAVNTAQRRSAFASTASFYRDQRSGRALLLQGLVGVNTAAHCLCEDLHARENDSQKDWPVVVSEKALPLSLRVAVQCRLLSKGTHCAASDSPTARSSALQSLLKRESSLGAADTHLDEKMRLFRYRLRGPLCARQLRRFAERARSLALSVETATEPHRTAMLCGFGGVSRKSRDEDNVKRRGKDRNSERESDTLEKQPRAVQDKEEQSTYRNPMQHVRVSRRKSSDEPAKKEMDIDEHSDVCENSHIAELNIFLENAFSRAAHVFSAAHQLDALGATLDTQRSSSSSRFLQDDEAEEIEPVRVALLRSIGWSGDSADLVVVTHDKEVALSLVEASNVVQSRTTQPEFITLQPMKPYDPFVHASIF